MPNNLFPAATEARKPVTLSDMQRCVAREMKYRERVYKRLIAQDKMTENTAAKESRAMRAIAKLLGQLEKTRPGIEVEPDS